MATPRQIRAELKRQNAPYEIHKHGSCWYVGGEGTECWYSTSLNTYRFDGATAGFWVDIILGMARENADLELAQMARVLGGRA